MPLTPKGKKVLGAMESEYGAQKGTSVFYASAKAGKLTGVHHSNAQNVQSFNDRVNGQEAPTKIGNPLAGTPTSYTNPKSVGVPNLALRADGTASPRETVTTKGPTTYKTPPIMGNSGAIRHTGKFTPKQVDTFGDGTLINLTPSDIRGTEHTRDADTEDSNG